MSMRSAIAITVVGSLHVHMMAMMVASKAWSKGEGMGEGLGRRERCAGCVSLGRTQREM